MILVMREQLRDVNSNVSIVELFPPAVQTELHDYEFGEKGKHIGMPLKDFTVRRMRIASVLDLPSD
jgi:short-subunit dehydrogenase involved in D-alanine esterification of teichoic acids